MSEPGINAGGATATLDPENPWLGLDSYTEATRAYFHGRDEEAAELARRVQHTILTVLFGQSGLGKTSLLRAGLVPRLRGEGYCPVYVRIDYAPESPSPAEQIKQAVFRATEAGHWTRPGAAIEGESLWEFLHHREDLLRDADGQPLLPLLIFDQFEEIFTLGQADDTGRARAQQFLEDLADLVENRAPRALEARLEEDDSAVEDFDFARADYRVLIALREDYLAHLESLKGTMPSITQNRMRLARMTGAQALSAVVKPGGKLVTQEVAEAIVRFVAGGSELANAEVEPSLLSLVCRELNTLRQAQQRAEISTDLLAGSRDTILSEFYERALADQPAGVRRVIEDELLTESGYRESLAEERVAKALADAGAAPDALATLVNRRLLRIEDRLDVRRVELTHDVLCSVVLASRNQRHEREAREAAEKQLVEQREREAATHRKLVRTRLVAGGCGVLLVLAIAGAVIGWISWGNAGRAEAQAKAARSHAEGLVSFMMGDLYNQLAPTGRLKTLGTLAQKTVDYYNNLPPALRTKQTQINKAMALARLGSAQIASGNTKTATKSFGAAKAIFKKLRAAGDHGEPVTYGLALILYQEGLAAKNAGFGSTAAIGQAAKLLRPLATGTKPSRRVRQLYANDLNLLCTVRYFQSTQKGLPACDEALQILADLGALNLSDLDAAGSWANTAFSKATQLARLGQVAEAQKLAEQQYALTNKILARRPADKAALRDRVQAATLLSNLANRRYDAAAAMDWANKAVQAAKEQVRFEPSDVQAWTNWAQTLADVANLQLERGEIARGIATERAAVALPKDPRSPKGLALQLMYIWQHLSMNQALSGDRAGAEQSGQAFIREARAKLAGLPPNAPFRHLGVPIVEQLHDSGADWASDAPQQALRHATIAIAKLNAAKIPATNANAVAAHKDALRFVQRIAAAAAVRVGRYAQAEKIARATMTEPVDPVLRNPQAYIQSMRTILALAIAKQGHKTEARKTLQPALDYYAKQLKAGAYSTGFRHDYAYALYTSAIAQPTTAAGRKQRKADLARAAKLIAGASAEAQKLTTMRYISTLIAKARHTPKP